MTLTEIEAAEELARILDSAPEDRIERTRWKADNALVINRLQLHIAGLQHRLVAIPAPPTPTRMECLLATYAQTMAAVKQDPGNRDLRHRVSTIKSNAVIYAKKQQLPEPEFEALPPIPDPLPKSRFAPETDEERRRRWVDAENEERQETLQQIMDMVEPGLESPALIREPEPSQAEVYSHLMACGDDCVHPDHHHHDVIGRPYLPSATDLARDAQRALVEFIKSLDALDDRSALLPAIDALEARVQWAYQSAHESSVEEAG